jgi:hypothetical protein
MSFCHVLVTSVLVALSVWLTNFCYTYKSKILLCTHRAIIEVAKYEVPMSLIMLPWLQVLFVKSFKFWCHVLTSIHSDIKTKANQATYYIWKVEYVHEGPMRTQPIWFFLCRRKIKTLMTKTKQINQWQKTSGKGKVKRNGPLRSLNAE